MKPQKLDTHVHVDQHTNVASSVEDIDVYHSFLTHSLP